MALETFDPDKHQFLVEGRQKCAADAPKRSARVYFKRGATGSGVIYLYHNKEASKRLCNEAEKAFGWISVPVGSRIRLAQSEGWCDWFADNEALPAEMAAAGVRDGHVIFCIGALSLEYSKSGPYSFDNSDKYFRKQEFGFGGMYGYEHDRTRKPLDEAELQELRDAMSFRKKIWLNGEHIPQHMREAWRAARAVQPQFHSLVIYPQPSITKEPIMTKTSIVERAQATGSRIIAANKQAAQSAAYLEAGNIANNQLAKVAGKKLPLMLRGYADTPWGKLVIANIAQQLAAEFRPNHKQLQSLTAAMTVAAYSEVIKLVNIDGVIDELLESKDIKAAMSKIGDTSED